VTAASALEDAAFAREVSEARTDGGVMPRSIASDRSVAVSVSPCLKRVRVIT
jgi:hypothetical protein